MGAFYSERIKAQVLGLLIVGLAVVAGVIIAAPHAETVKAGDVLIMAPIAAAIGIAIVVGGARGMPSAGLHVGVVAGIVVLTVANHLLGPAALVPVTYTWFALYAFAFFRRRTALVYMTLLGVSYAVVLTGQDVSSPVVRWLLGILTPLVAGQLLSLALRLAGSRTKVLEQSERRTAAIVEAAPNAFFAIDVDGRLLQWNREAERMFGWTREEVMGEIAADKIILDEDRDAHNERRLDAFKAAPDGPPLQFERRLMRKGGAGFPCEVTQSVVAVDDHSILVVFVRDLSDREQRERDREQLLREQAARAEAEHLAEMVQGLQELLDAALAHGRLEQMLEALLPKLSEVLDAGAASIFLADEDGRLVRRASTLGDDWSGEEALSGGVAGRVAESRSPLLITDPAPGEVKDPAMAGMNSILAVPLTAGSVVTGIIEVGAAAPREFDGDDLLLLGLAADRVALAVDHAQLFEREHKIAETLQRSLLPERLPALPGLDVAARYIPAKAEAEVGGDWYDVLQLDSSRVGLVMGDVAGKGLAAASMVGRLRAAMRAYALDDHEPAAVITRLNQLVWSEIDDSEMATLVYLVFDPAQGEVSWVSAGHPPPLVLGPGGPGFLEGPRSVPLGVMPFPSYAQGHAVLDGGSTLLLYTDGLVERPGEILDEGFARLAEASVDSDLSAEGLCEHILARLVPGGAMADDVALLALHQPLLSERFSLAVPSDPDQLASVRALLRRWLHNAEGTDTEVAEILAAAGEAASNAIEHSGQNGAGQLVVSGEVTDREVVITVRDEGRWLEPTPSEKRGRGLILMRELMDGVEVERGEAGTAVTMRRRLLDRAGLPS